MVTNIQFSNVESTDALKSYAIDKTEGLQKYFDNIQQADIDIGRTSNHHQKGDVYYAEINLHVPNDMIRVVKKAEDLYEAIDEVRDHMKMELNKYKEKINRVDKEKIRDTKSYQEEEEFEVDAAKEYQQEEYRSQDFNKDQQNEG